MEEERIVERGSVTTTMGSVMTTKGVRTVKKGDVRTTMVGGEDTGLQNCQGARLLRGC